VFRTSIDIYFLKHESKQASQQALTIRAVFNLIFGQNRISSLFFFAIRISSRIESMDFLGNRI
jgi:hypothetical protein